VSLAPHGLSPEIRHPPAEWAAAREVAGTAGAAAGLSYSQEMLALLTAVWRRPAPWSVRLKALMPMWIPWIRKRY